MNRSEFLSSYWRYYLSLERDFIKTIEYIELSIDNYSSYSINFARQLQSIGAELDNFFKEYCGFSLADRKNITDYANSIIGASGKYPAIVNQALVVKGFSIEVKPFANWNISTPKQSLKWWEAFDEIKHARKDNMKGASLKNVLNALGGLYILEMKHLSDITEANHDVDIPDQESDLFALKDWSFRHISLASAFAEIS